MDNTFVMFRFLRLEFSVYFYKSDDIVSLSLPSLRLCWV